MHNKKRVRTTRPLRDPIRAIVVVSPRKEKLWTVRGRKTDTEAAPTVQDSAVSTSCWIWKMDVRDGGAPNELHLWFTMSTT